MKLLAWMAGGIGAGVVLGFLTSGGEMMHKMRGGDSAYALGMVFGYVFFGALLGALAKFIVGRIKGR